MWKAITMEQQKKHAINHEQESTDDERITIDDINIVSQMNSSQIAIEEEEQEQQLTHSYNLRERPTKHEQQVLLAVVQGGEMYVPQCTNHKWYFVNCHDINSHCHISMPL